MPVKTTEVFEYASPRPDMVLELRAMCGVHETETDFVILRREDNGDVHLTVVEDGVPNHAVLAAATWDALISKFIISGETVQ